MSVKSTINHKQVQVKTKKWTKKWKLLSVFGSVLAIGGTTTGIVYSQTHNNVVITPWTFTVDKDVVNHGSSIVEVSTPDNFVPGFAKWEIKPIYLENSSKTSENKGYTPYTQLSPTKIQLTPNNQIKSYQVEFYYQDVLKQNAIYSVSESGLTTFNITVKTDKNVGYFDKTHTHATITTWKDGEVYKDVSFKINSDLPDLPSIIDGFDLDLSTSGVLNLTKKDTYQNEFEGNVLITIIDKNNGDTIETKISLLNSQLPIIEVYGSPVLGSTGIFNVNILSKPETYANKEYFIGWDLYDESGNLLNVNPLTHKKIPITEEVINDPSRPFNDNLDWAFTPLTQSGETVYTNGGVASSFIGIDNDMLVLVNDIFKHPIPNFGDNLIIQAVIYYNNGDKVNPDLQVINKSDLFKTQLTKIDFHYSANYDNYNELLNSSQTKKDTSSISFNLAPYNKPEYYAYKFKQVVNLPQEEKVENTPTVSVEHDENGYIPYETTNNNDPITNWKVNLTLTNEWHQEGIKNKEGQEINFGQREKNFQVLIEVYLKGQTPEQDKYITSVPVNFTILNAQRVVKYPSTNGVATISYDTVQNISQQRQNKYFELYFDKTVNRINRANETTQGSSITYLRGISFATNSQLRTIEDNAFGFYTDTLGNEHRAISTQIYYLNLEDCHQLTDIGNNAFYNCIQNNHIEIGIISLKTLSLPNKIRSIGNNAFALFSDLTRGGIESIVFANRPKDIDYGVKIGQFAFKNQRNLKSIVNCGVINELHHQSFGNCVELSNFNFDNVEKIYDTPFVNCVKLLTLDMSRMKKCAIDLDIAHSVNDYSTGIYAIIPSELPSLSINKVNLSILLPKNIKKDANNYTYNFYDTGITFSGKWFDEDSSNYSLIDAKKLANPTSRNGFSFIYLPNQIHQVPISLDLVQLNIPVNYFDNLIIEAESQHMDITIKELGLTLNNKTDVNLKTTLLNNTLNQQRLATVKTLSFYSDWTSQPDIIHKKMASKLFNFPTFINEGSTEEVFKELTTLGVYGFNIDTDFFTDPRDINVPKSLTTMNFGIQDYIPSIQTTTENLNQVYQEYLTNSIFGQNNSLKNMLFNWKDTNMVIFNWYLPDKKGASSDELDYLVLTKYFNNFLNEKGLFGSKRLLNANLFCNYPNYHLDN